MKEVKPSKKPLVIYYAIVLAVLLLLNLVLLPWMSERQVEEVDYGTFMTMTEEKNIGRVDIESNQIIFTDKEEKQVYKTGLMNDPELTQRLYDAGAQFSSEIVEQGSPMLNFLIWFLLPILLFSFIGNQMNKKLMEKAGGGPGSMMFGGVGKSNAKVYVQSTHGIAILHEKDKEFVQEGQRWWDLCRMKNAKDGIPLVFCIEGDIDNKVAILDQKTEAYKVLWPLDQNILDNDSALEQTPGYE